MINFGLTNAEWGAYKAALKQSHAIDTRVTLYDQNERVVNTICSARLDGPVGFIGGQVDVDATATTARRTATITLLDPQRKLHVVKDGSGDYTIWADSFIQIEYGVYVKALAQWVYCPVFHGPVTGFERQWPEVTIQAQGKEYLAMDPYLLLQSRTYHRGDLITNVVKDLMGQIGEWNFGFHGITERLSHKLVVPRLADVWLHCNKLADTTTRYLWYDGRGCLRFEHKPIHANHKFTKGPNGDLLSIPDFTYDFTTFHNFVDVTGGTPKKHKTKIRASESAGGGNPLSSLALARRGAPRRAVDAINDSQILRQVTAQNRAHRRLAADMEISTDAVFDALPVPFLDEHDWVAVDTAHGGTQLVRMTKWTMPLTDDSMSVGEHRQLHYVKHLRPVRAARHRHHRRHHK